MSDAEPTHDANHVRLCGRLGAVPELRDLPSGDRLMTFRVTVRRPVGDGPQVDTIDCVSTRPRVHRLLLRADPQEWLDLSGALRRRFFRGPAGMTQSRYAVDVETVRRVSRRRPASSAATAGA